MTDSESKKLSELKVVELRSELEKRGLDKNGVKQVLIERLHKALEDEEEDPETYLFNLSEEKSPEKPISKRPSISGKSDVDKTETDETSTEKSKVEPVENKKEDKELHSSKENGDLVDSSEKPQKEEDHESPITLTLAEEEKIHDDEATTESSSTKIKTESDEKKSTNEGTQPENPDKSPTEAETTKKEGGESSSSTDGKKVPSNANPRAIWISNVAMNTRACDIKQALSQYGKVVGAKVVVNAKYPGTCCFGYVTMGSVEDAKKVIENLNNTELNGQIIKIEKFDVVRGEQLKQIKNGRKSPERQKSFSRKDRSPTVSKAKDDAGKETGEDKEKKSEENKDGDGESKTDEKSEKDKKDDEKKRHSGGERKSRDRKRTISRDRPDSRSHDKKHGEILTFDKIREARERQRQRENERILRETARRRHEENLRQREVERRQRSEAQRLEREREKLRIEREKIEREKNELIRLERERQKIERERIELEKMELQRTRIRLEEDRRAVKRPAPYRREDSFEDRKRSSDGRHFNEPPPPPLFDSSSKMRDSPSKKFPNKDYKSPYDKRNIPDKRGRDYESDRSRPSSSSMSRPGSSVKFENRPYENIRDREMHERSRETIPSVSSRITKDHRFERERERSPHYRPGDRRVMPDEVSRFESRNTSSWSSAPGPKQFNSSSSKWPLKEDSWRQNPSSDRWNTTGRSPNFSGNSNMNMTPACPPPPGINNYPDRFDYNKIPSSIRKY